MKKIIIKNLAGIQTHGAEMDDPTEWIALCVAQNAWGKPERVVLHKDELGAEPYDDADVLEEEMRDTLDGVAQKWVKLKAQYTVEVTDISVQVAQEAINAEALAYLASTDWMVLRHLRQKALNEALSLSDEQYLALEEQRSIKAHSIARQTT